MAARATRRARPRRAYAVLAEVAGPYRVTRPVTAVEDDLVVAAAAAVDRLVSRPVESLDEVALVAELAAGEQLVRRIQARNCRVASTLSQLRVRRVAQARPDDLHAQQLAERETGRVVAQALNCSPSQVKYTLRAGAELAALPRTGAAFDGGEISDRHARVILDTVRHLDDQQRHDAERRLLDAARAQDPVALGHTARRLLAHLDRDAAVDAARRRHDRRYARVAQTPDGMLSIQAQLAGIDAEAAATAIDAFRAFDAKGDPPRTPEQRTADALAAALRSALDAGAAPTQHGERPHVSVVLNWSDLVAEAGVAELPRTGPIPTSQVRRLLADAGVCRILVGPDSAPLEVSTQVRTVPAALWRALVVRDGGCAWDGCSAPASWCEVAHLDEPWWHGGTLSLARAALMCGKHHTKYDDEGWTATVDGPTVTFHDPRHGPAP